MAEEIESGIYTNEMKNLREELNCNQEELKEILDRKRQEYHNMISLKDAVHLVAREEQGKEFNYSSTGRIRGLKEDKETLVDVLKYVDRDIRTE